MGFQVGLTEQAQADLGAVVRFLAEKNPEAALRIGNEILDTALALTLFPAVELRCADVRGCANLRSATT